MLASLVAVLATAANPSPATEALVESIRTFGTVACAAVATVGTVYAARANRKADAIGHAVNNVGPDEPRLVERVARVEARIETIAAHVGVPPTED